MARKIFWGLRISHEKCSEISPEIFEPLFCGPEKIPQNSRQISHEISLTKINKKITNGLLQGRREFQSINQKRELIFLSFEEHVPWVTRTPTRAKAYACVRWPSLVAAISLPKRDSTSRRPNSRRVRVTQRMSERTEIAAIFAI